MELNELVGEELAGKLSAMTDETVKQAISKLITAKLIVDDGKMIPKHVFDETNAKVQSQKDTIKKHETDLEALKGKLAGSESAQAEITRLQSENKTAKAEYEAGQVKLKKDFALQKALLSAGVNDETARNLLSKQFDLEKLELDDKGEVKGILDLLKPIKENASFKSMFGEIKTVGQDHGEGRSPNTTLSALETKLAAAQKSGNLKEVVALRNQMYEEQHKE